MRRRKGVCAFRGFADDRALRGVSTRRLRVRRKRAAHTRGATRRRGRDRHTKPYAFAWLHASFAYGDSNAQHYAHANTDLVRNAHDHRNAESHSYRDAYGHCPSHTDTRADIRWGRARTARADPYVSLYIGAARRR